MPGASATKVAPRNRLADRLPALNSRLEGQRAFRLEQLAELDTAGRAIDPGNQALREVTELIAAAAKGALDDIDIALLRMDIGSYGRCQTCHADIPIELLEAIPQARLCLACQRIDGNLGSRKDELPAFGRR